MSSRKINSKHNIGRQAIRVALGVGALIGATAGAQAQGIFTSNAGARSGFGQNSGVFGSANGVAAFPVGILNSGYGYGIYGVGGLTSPAANAAYFGYGATSLFGNYPYGYATNGFGSNGSGNLYAGSNISVVDSPLNGGFAAVNGGNAFFVGPNGQPADPALTNGGSITSINRQRGGINRLPGRADSNGNNQAGNGSAEASKTPFDPASMSPLSLKQMISARQDANFNLRVGWLGDVNQVDSMNVTLLNQYHLPIVSNSASNGAPVMFGANRSLYAVRYYRADIQFANGATASVTGAIKR